MTFRNRSFQLVLTLALGMAAFCPFAHATFPGRNGRIAFIQGADVYTMKPDGSEVRQLTALSDGNSAFWESWSADGKQLVFSEFPAPDFFGQLWVMNSDGSNQHVLVEDPGFDDETPSFSPDGSHVIFARCQPLGGEFPCAIYRVQVDGTGLAPITPVRIELGDFFPEYSPDGTTISFTSFGRGGILGALYQMNPDGSHIRKLTAAVIGALNGDWSPDGSSLAFSDHCCNPPLPSIYTSERDGGRVRRRTYDRGKFNDAGPSWAPEGGAIAFQRTNTIDGSVGIWVLRLDTNREQLIHTIPASAARRMPSHFHHAGRFGSRSHTKQVEDGGLDPRWGVAQ